MDSKKFLHPTSFATQHLFASLGTPETECKAIDLYAETLAYAVDAADRPIYVANLATELGSKGLTQQRRDAIRTSIMTRVKIYQNNESDRRAGTRTDGIGRPNPFAIAKAFLEERYPLPVEPMDDESLLESLEFATEEADSNAAQQSHTLAYALAYYREEFFTRCLALWTRTTKDRVRTDLTSFAQSVAPGWTTAKFIGDMIANLKALTSVGGNDASSLPFFVGRPEARYLSFSNGLLDLTPLTEGSGKARLRQHNPRWFSTGTLPYPFDPKATCPTFRKFIADVLDADPRTMTPRKPADNRILIVQEMFGYALLPDNRFQKFFVLHGEGWNGKGTLLDVLNHMVGPENVSGVTLEGMGRQFGTWPLLGKVLNVYGDMNEIDNAKEGTLKSWTGEDLVVVDRKHMSSVELVPTLKFVFCTNTLPWFHDRTQGIWRRMIVIPFLRALQVDSEADPHLRRKLKAELPGILNWAIEGLSRLLAQERFTSCDVCAAAAEQHRRECSPVKQFILDHFNFAVDRPSDAKGWRWATNAKEISQFVDKHNKDFGGKLNAHIVCRELAKMRGVHVARPKTTQGRTDFGSIYTGVALGEPRQLLPQDIKQIELDTGIPIPPALRPASTRPIASNTPKASKRKGKA